MACLGLDPIVARLTATVRVFCVLSSQLLLLLSQVKSLDDRCRFYHIAVWLNLKLVLYFTFKTVAWNPLIHHQTSYLSIRVSLGAALHSTCDLHP